MILTMLGGMISSVLSGGATGLLGVVMQRLFDWMHRGQDLELVRLNNAHALQLAQVDASKAERAAQSQERVAQLDADARTAVAQSDAQAREDEAAARSLMASYQADRASYLDAGAQGQSRVARWLMALVDFVRGIIRPGLTAFLVWETTILLAWARELVARSGLSLTVDQSHQLVMQIVQTVLYLATVAVVWWFGTRPPARKSQ
jgi:hypothetical protein